ncbi:hypothetical protein PSTG_10241 [Puccinia striiformis f. sp. tritici PST-78]|uniref:BED-type domain-containing protein n=1 Tax=Puccinia striiformis f. sp. tritici PST-78 TaxID=1165861 RepID=A0A0L0VBH4_9BASI|nr:hypothetical protein PSTG_10241 [Puccinia striiformis f. sp. tritici PST-78]
MSSTEPSNANEDECIRTEPETPGTSQPNTTGTQELTDREELIRAQKTATNALSNAYANYYPPQLSIQKDKRNRAMIAYRCRICERPINRPTSDSSCSNLLKHANACQKKQREAQSSHNLAAVGISGTGDVDPQEVPQLCAIWCAEAARPFSALADPSHKMILHPTVVKHMPSDKVLSRSVHMLYTAVQDSHRKTLIVSR